jgi:hypothetical protein
MLLGQILFLLAVVAIGVATAVGLVAGVAKLVIYKLLGRDLAPQPEPGTIEWLLPEGPTTVDLGRKNILTERQRHGGAADPVVEVDGHGYRVTRLDPLRFLITRVDEARRVGTFELDGSGRRQEVSAYPDDPADAKLILRVAVLASLVRRNAA